MGSKRFDMSYQMKVAMDEVFASQRKIDLTHKEITKIAYCPSKRQRELESVKAPRLAGNDKMLYKGEDLKRRPR